MYALDVETAPSPGQPQPYALQPWRAKEGKASMTLMSVAGPDGRYELAKPGAFEATLRKLEGQTVVTWNGAFDVAWCLAHGFEDLVKKITWVDAGLMWKWLDNSQNSEEIPRWSLLDGAKRFLREWEHYDTFVELKKTENPIAGEDDEYWETRCILDSLSTLLIAEIILPLLTPQQQRSVMIEAGCILPVAESWVRGIDVDPVKASSMKPAMVKEMMEIEQKLGVITWPDGKAKDTREMLEVMPGQYWVPSKILRSPKQKCELIYKTWGHEPQFFSDITGDPAADKKALTYLTDVDDRALDLLRWSTLNTQFTKFINGTEKAVEYLGSHTMHPGPRLFSTYTGRITYSTKSGGKGEAAKAKVGVPIHQWPRPKPLREIIVSHDGPIMEWDASGQEMRGMALASGDAAMLRIFSESMDAHSFTGATLGGMTYESFMKELEAKNEYVAGPQGLRYQGKFTNLSCISATSKVLTQYGWRSVVDVRPVDLLWDGVEWVAHSGVISRGRKQTINKFGIRATGDHKFLTQRGEWVNWESVREVDNTAGILCKYPGDSREGATAGQTKVEEVFDILDAGPRNRFTVQARDEAGRSVPVLAHNCQYRIGIRNLRIKARVDYAMDVDYLTAKQWQLGYFQTYPGVKDYWANAIDRAMTLGYAETWAGRRFYITGFDDPDTRWASESSAINFPIQGFGADMKEAALTVVTKRHPRIHFLFDLHDGLYALGEKGDDTRSTVLEVKHTLDNLPYDQLWGWQPSIPLPWDGAFGENWGKLEHVE